MTIEGVGEESKEDLRSIIATFSDDELTEYLDGMLDDGVYDMREYYAAIEEYESRGRDYRSYLDRRRSSL